MSKEALPRVVEATASDVGAIAAFFWEGWREAGPGAPGWSGASEQVLHELTQPEALWAHLGGPERRMFLAREGDRVVGFSATRAFDPHAVELAGIVVLQERVGLGIGTPLPAAAVAYVRAAGFVRMYVRTEAINTRAAGFYTSRGFTDETRLVDAADGRELELLQLKLELGSNTDSPPGRRS